MEEVGVKSFKEELEEEVGVKSLRRNWGGGWSREL